jgi:transposase
MFARKKKNQSGSVSIQVITKHLGRFRVVRTVGSSKDPDEIERLWRLARAEIAHPLGQGKLLPSKTEGALVVENFLRVLTNAHIRTIGPEIVFGKLFDLIGFNAIPDMLFRHLVVARLAYPASKLKTVDYLYRYQGIRTTDDALYFALDRIHQTYKADAERIAFKHTKKTLGTLSVVFYDMTTLYFEAEDEDDLRKMGWSKDGKNECPQIMVGLLVGEGGYPIGYDIFEGNTFEGKTLLPILEGLSKKYGLGKPVVVADAAMLSKKNVKELKSGNYTFIVGARIKNESDDIKRAIMEKSGNLKDGASFEVTREDGTRLIVTYSEKRARKDAYNREKGVKKLRKKVTSGKLTKEHIVNRGYNRFLTLAGAVDVSIDEERISLDARWDGLKGYVTNTDLPHGKVVEHYGHLWQIENAFRISKTDLRIRPIFHYKRRRIEAHLTIVFVSYAIWKELERLLKKHGVEMSPKRAAELTHTMYAIDCALPGESSQQRFILQMDTEQKKLYEVIHKR